MDCDKSVTGASIPAAISSIAVTGIGEEAFTYCKKLESVTLPNSLKYIDVYAFENCISLKNVIIPASVKTIGWWAFTGCKSLTDIIISEGVTTIESGAFAGCTSLSSITIPASVKSIGTIAFASCTALQSIDVEPLNQVYASLDGALVDKAKTTLLACPGGKSGTYVVPDNVLSIGQEAFSGCRNLKDVIIAGTVRSIGGGHLLDV